MAINTTFIIFFLVAGSISKASDQNAFEAYYVLTSDLCSILSHLFLPLLIITIAIKIPAYPIIPTIIYVTSKAAQINGIILKNIKARLKKIFFSF
jgi:hypothetical protein